MDLITKSTNDDRCQNTTIFKEKRKSLLVTARGSDGDGDGSEKQRRRREGEAATATVTGARSSDGDGSSRRRSDGATERQERLRLKFLDFFRK